MGSCVRTKKSVRYIGGILVNFRSVKIWLNKAIFKNFAPSYLCVYLGLDFGSILYANLEFAHFFSDVYSWKYYCVVFDTLPDGACQPNQENVCSDSLDCHCINADIFSPHFGIRLGIAQKRPDGAFLYSTVFGYDLVFYFLHSLC